jgi:translation initiation factor 2B subunit (eIF-2B alpha/beta/delta family)
MELEILLKAAQEKLQEVNFEGQRSKVIQLTAACELFARHVTRTALDIGDFEMCKERLIERGQRFATKADVSRTVIAENMHKFSKVPSIVMLYSKCARALTSENLRQAPISARRHDHPCAWLLQRGVRSAG